MKIHRIPSNKEVKSKRVGAYCRVSTRHGSQQESIETQKAHYMQYIQSKPEWTLVNVYADHGITGMSAKKRPAFQQMLNDARAGKLDLILVKSISRFSRNIVECKGYITELKRNGVEVKFEREGISTLDAASDFILSVLSIAAQAESSSISENVKWGYRKRFARGEYCLGNNRILGYDTDPESKKLVPNEDAWIVKLIFERFIAGMSYRKIAEELNKSGARRLHVNTAVNVSMLQYIVRNETYVGDKRLQKSPPVDILTGMPDTSEGYESYYIRDEHEGIIDRETWNKAQEMIGQRRYQCQQAVERGVSSSVTRHHVFYGKVYCGECGEVYTRRKYTVCTIEGKYFYNAWNCRDRQKGKKGRGCRNRTVKETELEQKIAIKAGWDDFDMDRFVREIERIEILNDDIKVVVKEG